MTHPNAKNIARAYEMRFGHVVKVQVDEPTMMSYRVVFKQRCLCKMPLVGLTPTVF